MAWLPLSVKIDDMVREFSSAQGALLLLLSDIEVSE